MEIGRSQWDLGSDVKAMIADKLDNITSSIQLLVETKEMFALRTFELNTHIPLQFFIPFLKRKILKYHPDILAIEELEDGYDI